MRTMVPPRPTSREETPMSATNDLLEYAHAYGVAFDKGDLPMPSGLHMAIVACTDARLNPYGLLGPAEGDTHVIRNAGGVITDDKVRSLVKSQRLLGTREIRRTSRRPPGRAPDERRSPSVTPPQTSNSLWLGLRPTRSSPQEQRSRLPLLRDRRDTHRNHVSDHPTHHIGPTEGRRHQTDQPGFPG
jgi:hypothetical protein